MAARKSCTHLTWAEAKSKVGGSSSGGSKGSGKGKNPPKGVSHNQILAQKIIAKQQQDRPEHMQEKLVGKKSLRKQTREDEKAAAALAAAKEERERERRERTVKPYDLAKERQQELAAKLLTTKTCYTTGSADMDTMKQIAECKGMQLDELMALEAILADTGEYGVCEISELDELRRLHETYLEDEENESALKSLIRHPESAFVIQLTVPDEMGILKNEEKEDMDLVASVVLNIRLPNQYPSLTQPMIEIHDCMVTDKNAVCSPDKPLETLAFLNETKLREALEEEMRGILPYPCVYEVGVTWLTENLYNYLELRPHIL